MPAPAAPARRARLARVRLLSLVTATVMLASLVATAPAMASPVQRVLDGAASVLAEGSSTPPDEPELAPTGESASLPPTEPGTTPPDEPASSPPTKPDSPPAEPDAAPPVEPRPAPSRFDPAKIAGVDGRVGAVVAAEREHGSAVALARAKRLGLAVDKGRVRVVIEATRSAAAKRSAIAAGAEVEAAAGELVQVLARPGQLAALRKASGIGYIRAPMSFVEAAVAGQGPAATNASAWHAVGVTGDGAKVAVIDAGFVGLAAAQANGDIPGDVTTLDLCSGEFATASEHGTGVAEIVHEMAPEAQLLLICVDTEVRLAQAVDYAKSREVDVISHSLGWLNAGRGDGTGPTGTPDATAADAAAAGILWVNAAGNEAQTHWTGSFVEASEELLGATGWQDFGAGDIRNGFVVGSDTMACVFLRWDDWPGSDQDYDLYVVDEYDEFITGSGAIQDGSQAPTEATCFANDGSTAWYYVAIHRYQATGTPRFDLFVLGTGSLERRVAAGSLLEPANSPATVAAGAACWSGTAIEPYSSRGPTIDGRIKPDITGQDGVSSFTYGLSSSCGAGGGFGGTSAAAPHVAGAAALVKSWHPEYGASQLRSVLTGSALDVGTTGADPVYGAGLLRLASPGTIVELSSSPNPSAVDQEVTLTAVVAPATATGTVTFRDVTGGGSTVLGTATLASGSADVTVSFPTGGSRELVAEYGGDALNAPATSTSLTHGVASPTPTPTTTTVTIDPNPVGVGSTATFTATVSPTPGSGTITWTIDAVEAETTPLEPDGTSSITRTYWEVGPHVVSARFVAGPLYGGSESAPIVLDVIRSTSIVLGASPETAIDGQTPVTFTVTLGDPDAWGSVTFIDTLGATETVLGTIEVAADWEGNVVGSLTTTLEGVGAHQVVAAYAGNGTVAPATSGPATVVVTPDTAVATGVGVQYSTFYPIKDGYRDTVAIRGTPGEPLSVTIKIYNSSDKRVRYWSLAMRSTPWSVNWNGRTASGTLLAAGKYRVVQKVTDLAGKSASFTSYTNLSNKRLYWYSGSKTKYADTGSFAWDGDAGAYYSNKYYRGVILDAVCYYECAAIGVHRFTLPEATAYSSIRFSVLGKTRSGYGKGVMGVWDYVNDELDVARRIGYSFTWWTTDSVGAKTHVDGRTVEGLVGVTDYNYGRVEYQKVKLSYKYAILK